MINVGCQYTTQETFLEFQQFSSLHISWEHSLFIHCLLWLFKNRLQLKNSLFELLQDNDVSIGVNTNKRLNVSFLQKCILWICTTFLNICTVNLSLIMPQTTLYIHWKSPLKMIFDSLTNESLVWLKFVQNLRIFLLMNKAN